MPSYPAISYQRAAYYYDTAEDPGYVESPVEGDDQEVDDGEEDECDCQGKTWPPLSRP